MSQLLQNRMLRIFSLSSYADFMTDLCFFELPTTPDKCPEFGGIFMRYVHIMRYTYAVVYIIHMHIIISGTITTTTTLNG